MSGDIRMGTRTHQSSPFKESAWDHRLDKMLDDLKTTVNPDETRSSFNKKDSSLVSSYRNTSRNDYRSSNREGVEDGGLMKHHHKEYISPDKGTKIVTDQYEYDSGDPNKFQKKVMKSTYSSYKVRGDIASDLDALRQGPSQAVMDAARATGDIQVVTASQKVANKLVDALSNIGFEDHCHKALIIDPSSVSTTMESQNKSDSSTMTKLNRNINELDSMVQGMDKVERKTTGQMTIITTQRKSTKNIQTVGQTSPEAIKDQSSGSCIGEVHSAASHTVEQFSSKQNNKDQVSSSTKIEEVVEDKSQEGYNSKHLHNGRPKAAYDNEEYIINGPGGEVRNIVWRNRFEKTYETHDSSTPSMTIEADAKRHKHKEYMAKATDISRVNPPVPPISPGSSQSWVDPIPLPTPPEVSPRGEPGVAYVYTYGQSGGTPVHHLPPLNYVKVPTGDGGSTTPSSGGNQPVIYHYSYHYTLQPGQTPPGDPANLNSLEPHQLQPALQVAPPVRSTKSVETVINKNLTPTEFAYKTEQSKSTRVITNENDRTLSNFLLHSHHHYPSNEPQPPVTRDRRRSGSAPRSGSVPRSPDITRRNINISINKSSTQNSTTTHTSTDNPKDPFCHNCPSYTSTPLANRERSVSLERETPYHTHRDPHLHYFKTAADSLDRLRKPTNDPLPFPDTSPITSTGESKIPRRIDDLMTSFSDSEDGWDRGHRGPPYHTVNKPDTNEPEIEPLMESKDQTDLDLSEKRMEIAKKDKSKNVAGPPVYYPPGHHQLFDESMHTMTLKENKRRGMAKWRQEKDSGYKDNSSAADKKGGMAMVPVCLPLCCGAACTIM